jgi:hypothetical protein
LASDEGWLKGFEESEDMRRFADLLQDYGYIKPRRRPHGASSKYKQRTVILYDARGRIWRIQYIRPLRPPTVGEKILSLFSRQRVPLEISVEPGEGDPLKVTKSLVLKAIDLDDDALTQFVEPKELKAAVEQTTSFETLYHALKETRSI